MIGKSLELSWGWKAKLERGPRGRFEGSVWLRLNVRKKTSVEKLERIKVYLGIYLFRRYDGHMEIARCFDQCTLDRTEHASAAGLAQTA